MNWGWGVVLTDEDLELGHDLLCGGLILGYYVQCSDSLSIQSHCLGKGLCNNHLETLIKEVSQSKAILFQVTRSKSLVSCIKEGEQVILFHYLGNYFPLFWGGVNSSWVVGAGVQEHNWTRLCIGQILQQPIQIESTSLGIVIGVVPDLKSARLEHLLMVWPGGLGDVHGSISELGEELTDDS